MISIKIVTPQGIILDQKDIISVTIPTEAGEITILEDHIPLVSILSTGMITVKTVEEENYLSVSRGVLEVRRQSIIYILADTAERAEDIDIERAEEARKKAEELLRSQENLNEVEFANIAARIEKELARERTGKKYRNIRI